MDSGFRRNERDRVLKKKPQQDALEIVATVNVATSDVMGWDGFKGIRRDHRLAFCIDGIHYDAIIESPGSFIPPGSTGDTVFVTASRALLETTIKVNSRIELKHGAAHLGFANVRSIKKIIVLAPASPEARFSYEYIDQ